MSVDALQGDYITDRISGNYNTTSTDEVRLNSSVWETIHEQARKNYDFFNDSKGRWINSLMVEKFTNNIDLIPNFAFPITNYLIIMQSTIYDRMTTLLLKNAGEQQDINDISLPNFRAVLQKLQYNLFLNGIGFVYVINKLGKIKLKSIKNTDIVYNYDFSKICVRARAESYDEAHDEQIYLYDYYELNNGKYDYFTFVGRSFFDLDFTLGSKITEETKKTLQFKKQGSFNELPIVYISKYMDNISKLNPIVQADEILNVLMAFGLAGAPMSLFVKIYVKNSNFGNGIDKLGGFSDLMDILQLQIDEEAGKVDTGDLTTLKNFFTVFEAVLGWFGQFIGLNQSIVSSKMNEVRKSGASKFADSRSGQIFRDHLLVKFDEFEDNLFESINSIRKGKKPYKFNLIDKNTSILSDPNDLADYFSKTVKEKFEGYIPALSKIHKITEKEARELAKQIKKQYDEFFPVPIKDNQKESKMMYGLKKGYLNDKHYNKDNEDTVNES